MSNFGKPAAISRTGTEINGTPSITERPRYLKGLYIQARNTADLSQQEAAKAMHVRQPHISAAENPNEDTHLRLDHIANASPAYRRVIVRGLAQMDGDYVAPLPAVQHTCEHARDRSITAELTDVLQARARSASREAQEREIDEAIAVLLEAKAALRSGH
jgi:transcriptional regulator with XRE-family HTH domain